MPIDERASFEEHFFDCSECLEQLEIARSLREAVKLSASTEPKASLPAVRKPFFASLWPRLALVAAGLIIVASPSFFLLRQRETARMELADARLALSEVEQTGPAVYIFDQVRGSNSQPSKRIVIPKLASWVVLSPELDLSQFQTYRAALLDHAHQPVWQKDHLRPASPDTIAISFLSTILTPGDYTLTLEGLGPQNQYVPVATFAFQAVREP